MLNSNSQNSASDFKIKLLEECKRLLNEKIKSLLFSLNEVTESSNSESKSSAGDKHETGKAMMQIEQEKLGKQLAELKLQSLELEKIQLNTSAKIALGSLIETDKGLFFIAIGLGKIKLENKEVFVVSALSPIGLQLIGIKGNSFELNGQGYLVISRL